MGRKFDYYELEDSFSPLTFPGGDPNMELLASILVEAALEKIPLDARIRVSHRKRIPTFERHAPEWDKSDATFHLLYYNHPGFPTHRSLRALYLELFETPFSVDSEYERRDINHRLDANRRAIGAMATHMQAFRSATRGATKISSSSFRKVDVA